MLPSSVRRVVSSGSQVGLASCLATSAPKSVATSAPIFVRGHQRRFSSSKPSRSDNGSSDVPPGQSVAASSPAARRDGKAGGESKKRKNKDASQKAASSFSNLPSVPTTHHISSAALGLSSFFSLHRPISVTETMPKAVSDEHFASIFAPRSKSSKIADTTSTLSNTIEQLDGPMGQLTIDGHEDGLNDGMHKLEFRNLDGTESSLYLQVDAMSGDFFPFRPPPLPQPQPNAGLDAAAAEAQAAEAEPQHRVYKAMFTIEESTDANGQVRIMAHSPRIINNDRPRSFLARLAQRQLRFEDALRRNDMHAISVRRQRKLRMKKKKYKKLMKKTRNLRRKLDRT